MQLIFVARQTGPQFHGEGVVALGTAFTDRTFNQSQVTVSTQDTSFLVFGVGKHIHPVVMAGGALLCHPAILEGSSMLAVTVDAGYPGGLVGTLLPLNVSFDMATTTQFCRAIGWHRLVRVV